MALVTGWKYCQSAFFSNVDALPAADKEMFFSLVDESPEGVCLKKFREDATVSSTGTQQAIRQ